MRFTPTPLVLLLTVVALAPLHAAPVQFNVPAQPATAALLAFAKQAGAEVIFSSDDLKTVQTNAVVGSYEPTVALALLLQGTGLTAKSNASGKFTVQRDRNAPKPGAENLTPSRAGDRAESAPRAANDDDIVRLEQMVVTPSRFGIAEERVTAEATLTKTELEALPQLGEDVFRTITRLPGLATDDLSARFWVRGAPQRQMLTRLDGVDLIEPFHLKDYDGALSIVDVETIGSINLVTGGFTAEHGDRLAGVLDIQTQSDPGARRRTTVGLSVTHLRVTSQGEFADGKGQWLAAARRGYIDLALELGGTDVGDDAPTYYDFSGKVEYRLTAQHALSLHVLHARDTYHRTDEEVEPDLRSSYTSSYVWGRWRGNFGDRLSGESVLSFSQLDWKRDGDGLFDHIHPLVLRDKRSLDTVGLRQDWTLNLTESALVRAGFELKSGEATYDYAMARTRWRLSGGNLGTEVHTVRADLNPDGEYVAAYVAPRVQLTSAFIVEPGLRFERHSHTGDSGWTPRLNASLTLGRTAVRAAWGRYEQAHGLHELSVGDGETSFQPAERAEHRVLGVSHGLPSGLRLRLEAYERLNSRLRPHWENLINFAEVFPEAQYDRFRFVPTRGRARGIELIAENRSGERFGWGASYSVARSEELIGSRWVPRVRDQQHSFYADVTWVPAPKWRLSCSWQIHTGWPVTDVTFTPQTLNDGTVIYAWNYGQPYALRAPAYHRLDLRATRVFQLKHGTLKAFVDIFNAYSHRNEFGFDNPRVQVVDDQVVVRKPPLKMFPILPSVGLSWEF